MYTFLFFFSFLNASGEYRRENRKPKNPVMCTGKGIMGLLIRLMVSEFKKKKTGTAGYGGVHL